MEEEKLIDNIKKILKLFYKFSKCKIVIRSKTVLLQTPTNNVVSDPQDMAQILKTNIQNNGPTHSKKNLIT